MTWCCFSVCSRRGFALAVSLTFVLDLLFCFLLFLSAQNSEQERHDTDAYRASESDTISICLVRMVLFPFVTFVALKVYRRTESESPFRALQQVATPADSLEEPLNEAAGANADKQLGEMKLQHNALMKKAERRKNIVMAILFVISTVMSMYNGLKCVNFRYDPHLVALQAALLFMVMIFINAEYFILRDLLTKLTEETGESIPHFHMHPLFFETGLKCQMCDICHEVMKPPHYIAYRCRICDFDLCPRCFKNKDKATSKGQGARAIRRDGEQVTTWTYFTRIMLLTLDFWHITALCLFCLIVCQGLQVYAPRIQGKIFDGILKALRDPDGSGLDTFRSTMIVYLTLNVLQGAFSGLKALSQELVTRSLACAVRVKLFSSIVRMDITFFDAMHTGNLTSRLTNDASQMAQPLNTLLNDLIANLMLLVGGILMAFETSWKLSILAITVVPPISFSYRLYAKWAREINRSIYAAYGEANKTATEAISNIRTVRGFSTEKHESDKYDDSNMTAFKHGKKGAYAEGSVNAFTTYLNLGTAVLILWYGGELVCDSMGQSMSIGSLITFQLYWNMMNNSFVALGNVFNDLIASSSAAERVFSLIDAKPDVDPDIGEEVNRETVKGLLELRDVEFRYRTRPDHLVLKGICLKMEPGTTTALVGRSGGGKSTTMHLLMRFYEPTAGAIYLDGQDTIKLSSRSLRKVCGFVSQDTQLFATSVVDNLSYGLSQPPTEDQVVAACKEANAHQFISEMEEEYETRVGEKGIMLSGGQKQRLAIARCFLRKPRLLFLDEPTSALDAENESLVQDSINRLVAQQKCTVVLVAHRLSTVVNSNQIAVVDEGRIVERGTHEELCKKRDGVCVYKQLVERQLARSAGVMMAEKSGSPDIDTLLKEINKASVG